MHNKRKKWLSSYVKKPTGLKHVMSVLAKEETDNSAFIATINSMAPPQAPALPPPPPTPVMIAVPPTQQPAIGAAQVAGNNAVGGGTTVGSAIARSFPASATRVTLNSILKPPKGNKPNK